MSFHNLKFAPILLIISLMCFAPSSWAGKVVKVKGKKVFIILSADEVETISKGDKMYLTTPSGKKKALIKIKKLRGKKAIAVLGKGKAKKGYLTMERRKKKKKKRMEEEESMMEQAEQVAEVEETSESAFPDLMWGFMGSFGSATQEIASSSVAASTSGSAIGFKGIIDYELFSNLGVRGRVGIDMFSFTGTGQYDSDNNNTLDTTGDFTTDISYLTIDFLLRYYIMRSSSFGLFVNGGMGIYTPMSTTLAGGNNNVGAIDEASISTTSLIILGGGVSFPIGGWEAFIGADYFIFPASDEVETTNIAGRIGLLFPL